MPDIPVKISELNLQPTITSDDFFPFVDSGSYTTYRTRISDFNNWLSNSGSCLSASYSITSSYSFTSSYSHTSSYSLLAATASYVNLLGKTASYALTASYAWKAYQADTSSYALKLEGSSTSKENIFVVKSAMLMDPSSSIRVCRKINRSHILENIYRDTIFFNRMYGYDGGVSNDWARIYYHENVLDSGKLYFELGDDIGSGLYPTGNDDIDSIAINRGGFVWSIMQTFVPYVSASLMFLDATGRLYCRSIISRDYSQSLSSGVGFYGTSSWAMNVVNPGGTYVLPPVGSIMDYAGTSDPSDPNWIICDGRAISRTTYSELFSLIGTTWGSGDGVSTFNIPDLRGRMTVGANGPYTKISSSVGNKGGGEALQNHYHIFGRQKKSFDSNGYTYNDDMYFWWIGNTTLKVSGPNKMFPSILSPYGDYNRVYLISGDETGNTPRQPVDGKFGGAINGDLNGNDINWCVGTSYAVSGSEGNIITDMMPPYVVVNKIIRIK